MTDPKDPEFIWKMVQECGEQERHFNTLQGAYRGLASSWLLAMFAGIGFILEKSGIEPKHVLVAISGACVACGIGLLWMLDIMVYHRLLLAAFVAGEELEKAYPWLPQVRKHMRGGGKHDAARRCSTWFYIGLAFVAVLVCAVEAAHSCLIAWKASLFAVSVGSLTALGLFIAIVGIFATLSLVAIRKADRLIAPPTTVAKGVAGGQ